MKKLAFIIYFFIVSTSQANEDNKEVLEIYKNLRCLVCQGQSVADSNSDFASTIKLVVRDQINQGKSKDEIYLFLISKYGEWIVYKPAFNRNNLILWVLPYLVLLLGGLIIFTIIRKPKNDKVN